MYITLFLLYGILIRRREFLLDVKWINMTRKLSAMGALLQVVLTSSVR